MVRVDLRGAAFSYTAGQAAEVGPAHGNARVPYSIASAPEEAAESGQLEFLIKVDSGGRWGEHFEPLVRGSWLAVRGPYGSFVLPDHPHEHRFAFIAGGTGIAPLRAMIRHAVITGKPPGTRHLLYSARTPRDFAYLPELRAMAREGDIRLMLTATRERTPRWRGAKGRIATSQLAALVDDPATLCFVCGPAAMVNEVPPMLRQLGINAARIRIEEW
jgi:NAD(P)H-flavin reductase